MSFKDFSSAHTTPANDVPKTKADDAPMVNQPPAPAEKAPATDALPSKP